MCPFVTKSYDIQIVLCSFTSFRGQREHVLKKHSEIFVSTIMLFENLDS